MKHRNKRFGSEAGGFGTSLPSLGSLQKLHAPILPVYEGHYMFSDQDTNLDGGRVIAAPLIGMEETPTKISKEHLGSLQHLSDILHLFHHRNKNQHRRSSWWRHFSLFRKHLGKLIVNLCDLKEVPITHLARTKKKIQDQQIIARVQQTRIFWRDVLVPKWQHAFSQVTADGRFAALGLVLLGALAEAGRIVGITAAYDDLGQADVAKVLEQFAEEGWDGRDDLMDATRRGRHEDLGEVVTRDTAKEDIESLPAITNPDAGGSIVLKQQAAPGTNYAGSKRRKADADASAKKKKKRRKGDTIDDLFSGVG